MIDVSRLDPPPIGVSLLQSADDYVEARVFSGVSYCEAVRQAGEGEALRVLPGSIEVCQWAPVVLGLKAPRDRFEHHLAPKLVYPVAGLLVAPLNLFPGQPEVVLLRTTRQTLDSLIQVVGRHHLWQSHGGRLDWSVAPLFAGGHFTLHYRVVQTANDVLAWLARSRRWQTVTHWLFRSHLATAAYDVIISHSLADMSMCRNSTVIPRQTGLVNVSFFCSGGITWGLNNPEHLTSGWPWAVFQRLRGSVQ